MKIGVFTSGGDAPGMNACLANIVEECARLNISLVAFYGGFNGLIKNESTVLTRREVQNISHLGGSIIKSMRCLEFQTPEGINKALNTIALHKLDWLIGIGGNGTFNGLKELTHHGVKVIGIPATIDNDMFYLDKTLGFDSAVNTVTEAVDKVKETMLSMNRGCLLEVMGRECGDIALFSAVATKANVVMVPERPLSFEQVKQRVLSCMQRGEESPMIVVSEYLVDVFDWAKKLSEATGIVFKANILGYMQRGGKPTVYDRMLAMQFGMGAVRLAIQATTSFALGVNNEKIVPISIGVAVSAPSDFNYELLELLDKMTE